MFDLKNVLRKVITKCTEYCCLCFETVNEDDSFGTRDEVEFETKDVGELYGILFTLFGENVINLLPTDTVCKKCTMSAINSYTFIDHCKHNIHSLSHNVNNLQKYADGIDENPLWSSLLMTIDPEDYEINEYYCENFTLSHQSQNKSQAKRKSVQPKLFEHVKDPTLIDSTTRNMSTVKNKKKRFNKTKNKTGQNKQQQYLDKRKNKISQNTKRQYLNKKIQRDIDEDLKCNICFIEFESTSKLDMHYLKEHAPKSFKCTECPKRFGCLFLLNRHIKNSHCSAICRYCKKIYHSNYALKHHEKSHKFNLSCEKCGKSYASKTSLNRHIKLRLCEMKRVAGSRATLVCNYCGKKYTHKCSLKVHLKEEHEEDGEIFKCDWCGKKFSARSRLEEHIVKHTKEKKFQCDTCGFKFVTKTSLVNHTRTHTGEKPHKCDHCNMRFITISRCSEHMKRNHEQDVECDICFGKYKGQKCMMLHRKKHFDTSSRLYLYRNIKDETIIVI